MKTYDQFINELFDNPIEVDWNKTRDKWIGKFSIKEVKPAATFFLALDNSPVRKRFYERFCEKCHNELNLLFFKQHQGSEEFFMLASQNYNGVDLALSIHNTYNKYVPR